MKFLIWFVSSFVLSHIFLIIRRNHICFVKVLSSWRAFLSHKLLWRIFITINLNWLLIIKIHLLIDVWSSRWSSSRKALVFVILMRISSYYLKSIISFSDSAHHHLVIITSFPHVNHFFIFNQWRLVHALMYLWSLKRVE